MTSEEKNLSDKRHLLLRETIEKIHYMINNNIYFEYNGEKYYEDYSPNMGSCLKNYILRNIHVEFTYEEIFEKENGLS